MRTVEPKQTPDFKFKSQFLGRAAIGIFGIKQTVPFRVGLEKLMEEEMLVWGIKFSSFRP
jgi:hypothetical protein